MRRRKTSIAKQKPKKFGSSNFKQDPPVDFKVTFLSRGRLVDRGIIQKPNICEPQKFFIIRQQTTYKRIIVSLKKHFSQNSIILVKQNEGKCR